MKYGLGCHLNDLALGSGVTEDFVAVTGLD